MGCPPGDANSMGKYVGGGGYCFGEYLTDVYARGELSGMQTTQWPAGSVQEAAWGIQANHGGGYAWRLCKTPDDGDMSKLTEECFQANQLTYANDKSYMQWGANT